MTNKSNVYTDLETFVSETNIDNKEIIDKFIKGDSLIFTIYRNSLSETMNKANYSLENITIFDDEIVFSLQRTYPIFDCLTNSNQRCIDYILINGLKDIIANLSNKTLRVCVDDTYYEDDYLGNITHRDLKTNDFLNREIYENIYYKNGLDYYNITDTYQYNMDKLIFKCTKDLDIGTKVSKIDLTKSDLSYIKKYFGEGYNIDIFHFYLIDIYTDKNDNEIFMCESSLYMDSYALNFFLKERRTINTTKTVYHYYYLVSHNKFQIDSLYGEDTLPNDSIIVYSPDYSDITLNFTKDGNNYNVNEISNVYISDYQLNDEEKYTILDYDHHYNTLYNLLGGSFNESNLKGFSSSDIYLLIERTANYEYEVNCTYKITSYDKTHNKIYVERYFDKANGSNNISLECVDYVILRGELYFDIYNFSPLTKVIITDYYQ